MSEEEINHPKRYNSDASGVECIDVIEHFPHNLSRAIEYCWRCELKGSAIQDLQKALWYLNRAYEKCESRLLEEHGSLLTVLLRSDNQFLRTMLYHLVYPYQNGRAGIRAAFRTVRAKLEAMGGSAPGPYNEGLFIGEKDPQ